MSELWASVRLRAPNGTEVDLVPGDLIGRVWSAALRLDDPRVSEAHALVSLRGAELRLLALRGPLICEGAPSGDVSLVEGQRVRLAEGLELVVVGVSVPAETLGLRGLGRLLPLSGAVQSLLLPAGGDPGGARLEGRFLPHAAAWFWSTSGGWEMQVAGEKARAVEAGDRFQVGPHALQLVTVPVHTTATPWTERKGRVHAALDILARFETVHLRRENRETVVLTGLPARLFTALAELGGPVAWETLAGEIWRRLEDRDALRMRLDRNLATLRARLRAAGIRDDLVRATGKGQYEIVLTPEDTLTVEG